MNDEPDKLLEKAPLRSRFAEMLPLFHEIDERTQGASQTRRVTIPVSGKTTHINIGLKASIIPHKNAVKE